MNQRAAWIGAEAEVSGRPLLLRARTNAREATSDGRPHLLVIDFSYAPEEPAQLPADADYAVIEGFEAHAFDSLSPAAPILVFVETGSGCVRYFTYVADVEASVAWLDDYPGIAERLEISTAEDPGWETYDDLMRGLTGPQ